MPVSLFCVYVDFCYLLTTKTNSLDPDQAQQNVGPDLDPNCLGDVVNLSRLVDKDFVSGNLKSSFFPSDVDLSPAYYLVYKQFGRRSGLTICWAWSESKLFDTNGYVVNLSRLVTSQRLIRTLYPVIFFLFISTFVTC